MPQRLAVRSMGAIFARGLETRLQRCLTLKNITFAPKQLQAFKRCSTGRSLQGSPLDWRRGLRLGLRATGQAALRLAHERVDGVLVCVVVGIRL